MSGRSDACRGEVLVRANMLDGASGFLTHAFSALCGKV